MLPLEIHCFAMIAFSDFFQAYRSIEISQMYVKFM